MRSQRFGIEIEMTGITRAKAAQIIADFCKGSGSLHVGHRQSGNLAAGGSQSTDLGKGAFHIGGFGIEHGLDHHGSTAAHGDSANYNLSCHIVNL